MYKIKNNNKKDILITLVQLRMNKLSNLLNKTLSSSGLVDMVEVNNNQSLFVDHLRTLDCNALKGLIMEYKGVYNTFKNKRLVLKD